MGVWRDSTTPKERESSVCPEALLLQVVLTSSPVCGRPTPLPEERGPEVCPPHYDKEIENFILTARFDRGDPASRERGAG